MVKLNISLGQTANLVFQLPLFYPWPVTSRSQWWELSQQTTAGSDKSATVHSKVLLIPKVSRLMTLICSSLSQRTNRPLSRTKSLISLESSHFSAKPKSRVLARFAEDLGAGTATTGGTPGSAPISFFTSFFTPPLDIVDRSVTLW